MNPPPEKKDAKAIFSAAVEYYMPEQWEAYIVNACGDDEALRQRVRELLDAHRKSDSFFDREDGMTEAPPISERTGSQIGPYKLLQEIGEGGFGVVYMAEQLEPIRRKVALKIIKPGMDTKQVIARFEAERQALAMMDHPNIAKVLDAGATESGRPYFVMQLVKGVPITEFCDANKLSTHDRLELFVTVCHAVQHAHQKGVIHRDLKPSNVMVTLHENRPMPVIIDFGVSKAISHQLTEKTLFTAYGQMVGTPAYMSPEQAQMSHMDIDTRSDVYSLGVLLYELLTGSTPLDAERLRGTAYAEMQRLIREEDAPKPSIRLSTLGDALAKIAQARGTDPKKLGQFLRGDLDWIVLKALEKERNRRYETANGMANDIERFLNDETVEATPPSLSYQLRKFVGRNRGLATTTAAVGIAVLLGIVGTTIGMVQARQDSTRARAALNLAEQAKVKLAEKSSQLAETNSELTSTNNALNAEQQRSQDLISQLRRQSATMAVDKGNRLIRGNDVILGMLWLTRGLELAQQESSLAGFATNIRRGIAAAQATVPKLVRVITPDHSIEDAVHSSDGRFTAVSGGPWAESGEERDNHITVWDNQTGQQLARTTLDRGPLSLDFRPDGKALLICGAGEDDKSAFLMTLDISDGATQRYKLPESLVPAIAVFGHEDAIFFLVAGDVERKVVVLETLTVDDGELIRSARKVLRGGPSSMLRSANASLSVSARAMSASSMSAFTHDRTAAVTATANGVMRWDLTDEEAEGQRLPIDEVAQERVYRIVITPDAASVLVDFGRGLSLYRLSDGHLLWEIPFDPLQYATAASLGTGRPSELRLSYESRPIVFSPDGSLFLVYEPESKQSRSHLEVRSTETGELVDAFHDVCRSGRAGIAWLRGKNAFVVGTKREGLVFRFPSTSALAHDGRFRLGKINQTVGDIILNFGREARTLRDIKTGQVRMQLSNTFPAERRNESIFVTTARRTVIQRFRESSRVRSSRLRIPTRLTTVEIYDSRSGEKRDEYQPEQSTFDAKLSPDGRWIAHSRSRSRFYTRLIDIHDAENGDLLTTIEAVGSSGRIVTFGFSKDGRQLAVLWSPGSRKVNEDATLHVDVWNIGDLPTEPSRRTIWQHSVHPASSGVSVPPQLQFSEQGDKLLMKRAGEVWVLDVEKGGRAVRLHNLARQAAMLPDGQGVVVLDAIDGVQLVDLETRQVFPFRFAADAAVKRMLFSSDGTVLATTIDSLASPVRYWKMPVAVTESPAELKALLETASHVRLTEQGDFEVPGIDLESASGFTSTHLLNGGPELDFVTRDELLAVRMLDQQQWAAAIPQLERLIDKNPQNLWARAWRYRCLVELDRLENAAGELEQFMKIAPRDPNYATAIAASLNERIEELDRVEDRTRIDALRSLAALTSPAPEEVYAEMSSDYARQRQWKRAIEALQQAAEADPEEPDHLHVMAILALIDGDQELYQRTCQDLLDRYRDHEEEGSRWAAARASLLQPVNDDSLQRAAALMDEVYKARPATSLFRSTKGLADYRRGHHESSEQVLTALLADYEERSEISPIYRQLIVPAELVLAMTYHRLHEPDKARELFDRASKRIDAQWDGKTGSFVGDYHPRWLVAMILHREAERLLAGASTTESLPATPSESAPPSENESTNNSDPSD